MVEGHIVIEGNYQLTVMEAGGLIRGLDFYFSTHCVQTCFSSSSSSPKKASFVGDHRPSVGPMLVVSFELR